VNRFAVFGAIYTITFLVWILSAIVLLALGITGLFTSNPAYQAWINSVTDTSFIVFILSLVFGTAVSMLENLIERKCKNRLNTEDR